jgi:hypothetical protein
MLYLVVTLKLFGLMKLSFVYNKMVLTLKMTLIHAGNHGVATGEETACLELF